MEPQPDQQPSEAVQVEPPAKRARKPAAKVARKPSAARVAVKESDRPTVRTSKHSFSLSDNDLALIAALKQRSAGVGRMARKSEIVRAALHLLGGANTEDFTGSLAALTPAERKKKR